MSFVPNLPIPPQVANPQLKLWLEQTQQMTNWYLMNLQNQMTDFECPCDPWDFDGGTATASFTAGFVDLEAGGA